MPSYLIFKQLETNLVFCYLKRKTIEVGRQGRRCEEKEVVEDGHGLNDDGYRMRIRGSVEVGITVCFAFRKC